MKFTKILTALAAGACMVFLPMMGAHAETAAERARYNAGRLHHDRVMRHREMARVRHDDAVHLRENRARVINVRTARLRYDKRRLERARSNHAWYAARRQHDDAVQSARNRAWRAHHRM